MQKLNDSLKSGPDNTGEKRDEQGRFIPGTSGNLSGRPKGSISIRDRIKQRLEEIPDGEKETYLELIVKQVLGKAVRGDFQMLKLVWEHTDGRPTESLRIREERLPVPILGGLSLLNK